MTKRLNKKLIERAEKASERLARATEILEGLAWDIDSALSAIRKDAAGYRRGNKANPEGGDNYTPGELEDALARFDKLAVALLYFEVYAGKQIGEGPYKHTAASLTAQERVARIYAEATAAGALDFLAHG